MTCGQKIGRESACCDITCCKLLYGHEGKADEGEGFPQNAPLVLRCGLQLLAVSLCLGPTHRRSKQPYLPHPECVPLQHSYKRVWETAATWQMKNCTKHVTTLLQHKQGTEIFPLDTWKSPDCVIRSWAGQNLTAADIVLALFWYCAFFHWQTTHTHWS